MDLSFRHDLWWARLPASPTDEGRVHRCVLRTGVGERETPDAIELAPGEGCRGDSWLTHRHREDDGEVALMNVHVLRSVADGDEERMPLAGDNLVVDLDLSEANLPVGTRLAVGEAELEVTALPHRPCRSFHERFGALAAKRVARANRRGLRGRGVYGRIVRGGTVRVGDPIRVHRPD